MKNTGKRKRMGVKAAAFLLAVAAACLFGGCAPKDTAADTAKTEMIHNGVLENYSLNVQVQGNNRLVVSETLTVNYDSEATGITRVIPYEGYRYDPEKNEVIQYRMAMDQLRVDGGSYAMKKDSGKIYLTVGAINNAEDADKGGIHIYTVRYRLSCYADTNPDADMLLCNLLPYEWKGSISNANISITMPKDFESSGVKLYHYQRGSWMLSKTDYTVSGKTITAYLNADAIKENNELTLKIILPEGYFKYEKSLIPLQMLGYVILVLLVVGISVLWWLFGRRKPSGESKATVLRKHKLTALEDAYLMRRTLTVTDVLAQLTAWAEQGVIQITQLSAEDYTITVLAPLDKAAKSFEFALYDALFASGNKTLHIGAVSAVIRRNLPKIKRLVAKDCAQLCGGRLFTIESGCTKAAAWVVSAVPIYIVLAVGGYVMLDYSAKYVGLIAAAVLFAVHGGILLYARHYHSLSRMQSMLWAIILGLLEILVLGGSIYFAASVLLMSWQIIVMLAAVLVMLVAAVFSGRESNGYQNQLAQLTAYKRYLKNPVPLPDDVSAFYFAQLPQAYVLRMGKMFSKKCDVSPIAQHGCFIFRDESAKLSRTAGFYQAYLRFISAAYRAEAPASAPLIPKKPADAAKPMDKPSAKPAEKPSAARTPDIPKEEKEPVNVFAVVLGTLTSFFQHIAIWVNEGIDWVEAKYEQIKYKFSKKEQDTEAEGENEEGEE